MVSVAAGLFTASLCGVIPILARDSSMAHDLGVLAAACSALSIMGSCRVAESRPTVDERPSRVTDEGAIAHHAIPDARFDVESRTFDHVER